MYELFVLGELITGEKHGYMLQEVLKSSVGLGRKISSGTLYPLLSRMTGGGWIRLRLEEETKGGRTRKIFEITEAGRARFMELMAQPLDAAADADLELTFRFKMVYFQYVPKAVRLACLEQYLQILELSEKRTADFEALLQRSRPEPEQQRVQLLRVCQFRRSLDETGIRWIREELDRIREQQDE